MLNQPVHWESEFHSSSSQFHEYRHRSISHWLIPAFSRKGLQMLCNRFFPPYIFYFLVFICSIFLNRCILWLKSTASCFWSEFNVLHKLFIFFYQEIFYFRSGLSFHALNAGGIDVSIILNAKMEWSASKLSDVIFFHFNTSNCKHVPKGIKNVFLIHLLLLLADEIQPYPTIPDYNLFLPMFNPLTPMSHPKL